MTGCRIRSVKWKKSPHLVEIIPKIRGVEFKDIMHDHVDKIASFYPDGMAGFAIVAWGFDGKFSRGTRIHNDSFVGQTLLPSFVADILRRDIMGDIINDTIF